MSTQERPLRKGIFAAILAADGKSPLAPKTGDEEPKSGKGKDGKAKDKDKEDDHDSANKGAGADTGEDNDKKDDDSHDGKHVGKDAKEAKEDKPPKPTRIDLKGLADRFVPIPVAERNYDDLIVASDGALFYLARRQPGATTEPPGPGADADGELFRYSFEDRAEKPAKAQLVDVSASPDHKKLLLTLGERKLEAA